jgi:hypothetical protein
MFLGHDITRIHCSTPNIFLAFARGSRCGKIRAAVTEDELRRAYLIFVIFVTFVTKRDRFPQMNMAAQNQLYVAWLTNVRVAERGL